MVLQPDQERVRSLLTDTITLLCKNGLNYKDEFCISGVIGITLDKDDVFLVDIRETITSDIQTDAVEESSKDIVNCDNQRSQKRSRKDCQESNKRSCLNDEDSASGTSYMEAVESLQEQLFSLVKEEKKDDSEDNNDCMFVKQEPGLDNASFMSSLASNEPLLTVPTLPVRSTGMYFPSSPQVPSQSASNAMFGTIHMPQKFASQPKEKNVYTCNICQQTMGTSNGLRYHMNRHKGIFPYYCPYCNKGQPGTTDLKNHLGSVHTNGVAAYLCVYCQHTAASPQLLKSHLQTCERNPHSGSPESNSSNQTQNADDTAD